MTTRQLTRRVLSNTNRFIIGDYNGEKWYCPDGKIATIDNIYEQYVPKKSQVDNFKQFEHVNNQPKMNGIFEQPDVTYSDVISTSELENDFNMPLVTRELYAKDVCTKVNNDYYNFLTALYPNATVRIVTEGKYKLYTYPVRLVQDNKIVALIMPLVS